MYNPPGIDDIDGEAVTNPVAIPILDECNYNDGGTGVYKTTKTG